MNDLHTIALTVRQPADALYHSVLLECVDSRQGFNPIVMSSIGFPSFLEAMDAGVEVIRCMSDTAPPDSAVANALHAAMLTHAVLRRAAA